MVSVMSWVAGESDGHQHLVAWLALLFMMAGVLVTFRKVIQAAPGIRYLLLVVVLRRGLREKLQRGGGVSITVKFSGVFFVVLVFFIF